MPCLHFELRIQTPSNYSASPELSAASGLGVTDRVQNVVDGKERRPELYFLFSTTKQRANKPLNRLSLFSHY